MVLYVTFLSQPKRLESEVVIYFSPEGLKAIVKVTRTTTIFYMIHATQWWAWYQRMFFLFH